MVSTADELRSEPIRYLIVPGHMGVAIFALCHSIIGHSLHVFSTMNITHDVNERRFYDEVGT
jgi:hypothetical protein